MVRINLQRFLIGVFIVVAIGAIIGVPIYHDDLKNNFNKSMAILGYNTKGGTPSNIGKFFASRFVIPEAGILSSISVYLKNNSGSAQNIQVGIYNDNAGAVGTKLVSSANVSIPNGFDNWKTINLSSNLSLGAAYWLSFQFESGAGGMWLYYDSGDENQTVYAITWTFGTWPDYPTGLTYFPAKISVYATYTPVVPSAYTWGLLSKNQIDPEKVEEAIARLIVEHEEDPDSHLDAGESLQSHRAAEIIDHIAGSVVADKLQAGGLILTTTFENLNLFTLTGNVAQTQWPGIEMYGDLGTPKRARVVSVGSNVRDFIDFNFDFMVQFAFFLAEESSPSASFSFGHIVTSVFSSGVALEMTPATDRVHLKITGYDIYSADLNISRAAWHTFRMYYNATDEKLYCFLDSVLVATLDYPSATKYSPGPDLMIDLLDGVDGSSALLVEYVLVSRGS